MELKGYQRSYLTKLAHNIKPLVMIGTKGLTEAIVKQAEEVLELNELVKVKFVDFKRGRKEISAKLADQTTSDLVRVIGNTAILYRAARDPEKRQISIPVKKK